MRDINGIDNSRARGQTDAAPIGPRLAILRSEDTLATPTNTKRVTTHPIKSKNLRAFHFPRLDSKSKRLVLLFLILPMCAAIGVGVYRSMPKHVAPVSLPAGLITGLPYQVYYLKEVANSYELKSGSANVKSGILFYALQDGKKQIFVTEQQLPSNVSFSSLPNHNIMQVPIGRAFLGTGLGNPSVVIMTPQTLIELTSNKNVGKTDVIYVAQQLTEYQQQ